MRVAGLDHVTVCARDVARSVAFWRDVVGLEPGPRPAFDFDGAWLYCDGRPIVHLVARRSAPGGAIDHIALRARGLSAQIARLKAHDVAFSLTALPEGVPQSGERQLFFHDPDGARIEMVFAASEDAG